MDETKDVILEGTHLSQENKNNDVLNPEEIVGPKTVVDEIRSDMNTAENDSNNIGNGTENALNEPPDSPRPVVSATEEYADMAMDEMNTGNDTMDDRGRNTETEEHNGGDKEVERSQDTDQIDTSNGANKLETQDSAETSENKDEEAAKENSETTEMRNSLPGGKTHAHGSKHYIPPGWVYHGESDGYRYYIGSAGEMYSVDRDGYWYIQDSTGNFVPYTGYQYSRGPHTSLFPRDSKGRFILPTNTRGEKAFPVDTNNMPIFPFDSSTHLPTFPVDENGQPVFPTGGLGRPIVPVDTNGIAIFPRDGNGRFIFPSGPNGKPTAPVNIFGVPVMPLDEHGKPVVPYDATGSPLIHLASDGITPLTEEEYQYSLQWNDYYNRYYKTTTTNPKPNTSRPAVVLPTTTDDTYEQKAKNMKLLKKVRPEDIDLPPSVPPPPTVEPPTVLPAPSLPSSDEAEKPKTAPDPALKAKTKKMIEMQLKFSRKKLQPSALAPPEETTNTSADHATAPVQPSSPLENAEKIESPKERPPPPPPLAAPPSPPILSGNESDAGTKAVEKLVSSSEDAAKVQEQAAVPQVESSLVTPSATSSPKNASDRQVENSANPELSVETTGNAAEAFSGDNQVPEKEITKTADERVAASENMDISTEKQAEPALADVTNGTNLVTENQSEVQEVVAHQEDNGTEKMKSKIKPLVGNNSESKPADENRTSRKHDDKEARASLSREKRVEKSRNDERQSRDRKRSESRRRRSRSRSSYRDSRRRSRSREWKRRSRSHTRSPQRDYYYRGRYRSRSRDRYYRHESSYYDRHSYRRHWTPDAEERYSRRRRRSSSRGRSPLRERSMSRDRTPTDDKSSRSRSYEKSKSRSGSPDVSRHSSVARSDSQQHKTTSASRHDSPEDDVSEKTKHDSRKSPKQLTDDATTIDEVTDTRKSASRSASPPSAKSSVKEEPEVKAEKSKKRKKAKEKHKKKKKSHHKKRDKRKRSPSAEESEPEDKRNAPLALPDEANLDIDLTTSMSGTLNKAGAEIPDTKESSKDGKKEKSKRRKEKKRKKERHDDDDEKNRVGKKISQETLEEGEIITEKDLTPRAKAKVLVSYATSDSDGEENVTEKSKSTEAQLIEDHSRETTASPMTQFTANPKMDESFIVQKDDLNEANTIQSSVLSLEPVDEIPLNSTDGKKKGEELAVKSIKVFGDVLPQVEAVEKVASDDTDESLLEKKLSEQMPQKQDIKITVELEDDGISSKLKDLTGESTELTAREAEKLKTDSITEAMNKLKKLRGYKKTEKTVSSASTETPAVEQENKATGKDFAVPGYNIADVPLPKEIQVTAEVTERAEQTVTPEVRTQEASTSAKIGLVDKEAKRKKEILKRKWEEDEEDELSRLRYEALRSKTRRLMNDLRAERRRLKRERLRATIAMRRARERSDDTSVDEILFADTSDSTETDDSDDYSASHKRKLLKRKRYGGAEGVVIYSNKNKSCGLEQRGGYDGDGKQQQQHHQNLEIIGGAEGEQSESSAPNNLILELQQRIGGSNESALALLEQLKKCLAGGVVSTNIHVNPEVIRKNA